MLKFGGTYFPIFRYFSHSFTSSCTGAFLLSTRMDSSLQTVSPMDVSVLLADPRIDDPGWTPNDDIDLAGLKQVLSRLLHANIHEYQTEIVLTSH